MAAQAFAALGTPKNGGTRLFCLSGHVNKTGRLRTADGLQPCCEMINEVGGGIRGRQEAEGGDPGRIVVPGAEGGRVRIADGLRFAGEGGSMLGSGGMVVMDEDTDMVKVALRIMQVLCARKLRLVHPVPRRYHLAEEDPAAVRRRRRSGRRHRPDRRTGEEHAGPDVLRAGRCGRDADHLDSSKNSATNSRRTAGSACPYEHAQLVSASWHKRKQWLNW